MRQALVLIALTFTSAATLRADIISGSRPASRNDPYFTSADASYNIPNTTYGDVGQYPTASPPLTGPFNNTLTASAPGLYSSASSTLTVSGSAIGPNSFSVAAQSTGASTAAPPPSPNPGQPSSSNAFTNTEVDIHTDFMVDQTSSFTLVGTVTATAGSVSQISLYPLDFTPHDPLQISLKNSGPFSVTGVLDAGGTYELVELLSAASDALSNSPADDTPPEAVSLNATLTLPEPASLSAVALAIFMLMPRIVRRREPVRPKAA